MFVAAMRDAAELAVLLAEAYNSHDPAAICALCSPEVEILSYLEGQVDGQVYRGHKGIHRWQRDEAETWDRIELIEPRAESRGPGLALGIATVRAVGRRSAVAVEAEIGLIFEASDGALDRVRSYDDVAHARTALEDGPSP